MYCYCWHVAWSCLRKKKIFWPGPWWLDLTLDTSLVSSCSWTMTTPPLSTTAQALAISFWLGDTMLEAMTNASVEAMAMVRTMKNIAMALQLPEQLLRSLENAVRLGWDGWPGPGFLTVLPRVLRLLWRVPDSCFSWVVLLKCFNYFYVADWVQSDQWSFSSMSPLEGRWVTHNGNTSAAS